MRASFRYTYLFVVLTACCLYACDSEKEGFGAGISQAQDQILAGKVIFENQCSTCHNFQENAIGPNLSGLTRQVDADWIRGFVVSPSSYFDKEDERALTLLETYNTPMPAFGSLEEGDLDAVLSYMHTFATPAEEVASLQNKNWIEEGIEDSGIRIEIEEVFQLPPSDTIPPLAKMTKMEPIPGSDRLMINDQRVGIYELIDSKPSLFLNLKDKMDQLMSKPGWGTGLGSFAFHPDYLENGLFYTAHTEPGGTATPDIGYTDSLKVFMQWVLMEWENESPRSSIFEGSSREMLRIDIPSQAHGMQELAFNPTARKVDEDYGLLYIGFGDGGTVEQGFANISNSMGADLYSSILRIDPLGRDSKNGQYGIPKINPFSDVEGKAGEVYANGFRNPNRLFWDKDGNFFATDIGQHTIEEINRIEPGKFYGWPFREGTFKINPYGNFREIFPLNEGDDELDVTYPLIQMEHDELAAIFAGYFVEEGELSGNLIFGDILSGRLFHADISQKPSPTIYSWAVILDGKEMTLQEMVGEGNRVDLKFGKDASGNLYIMSKTEGKVFRMLL